MESASAAAYEWVLHALVGKEEVAGFLLWAEARTLPISDIEQALKQLETERIISMSSEQDLCSRTITIPLSGRRKIYNELFYAPIGDRIEPTNYVN
jgi:hypothetical protein